MSDHRQRERAGPSSPAPLTNALTTITLGSATNPWGHGWTAPQFGTSSFRVRVIDVSTQTNRTFSLDYAGVQVSYTP